MTSVEKIFLIVESYGIHRIFVLRRNGHEANQQQYRKHKQFFHLSVIVFIHEVRFLLQR